jgi:guanosine-3',5'-bis(diphosphate) 3'-pyrophosphohydrolase
MIAEEEFGLFLAALRFSAGKHSRQRRKDAARTPYINHPIQVAGLLWTAGGIHDMSILIAAILHDTVEDTDASPEQIRNLFGGQVLGIVLEVTDDKSLPKEERKRLQIIHAPRLSPAAKCIKLADKISNLRDITQFPPADWPSGRIQEYFRWSEKVVAGLRGANPALEACYDSELARARDKYFA